MHWTRWTAQGTEGPRALLPKPSCRNQEHNYGHKCWGPCTLVLTSIHPEYPQDSCPTPYLKSACCCPPAPHMVQLRGPSRGGGASSPRPASLAETPPFRALPPRGPSRAPRAALTGRGLQGFVRSRRAEPRGGAAARRAAPCPHVPPRSWLPTLRTSVCGYPALRPAPVGTSCRPEPLPAPPRFPGAHPPLRAPSSSQARSLPAG